MAAWIQDLRFALRALARQPGFTTVAVLTLALGIGAGTAVFSVVHGVMLEPLPFEEPEELYRLADVFRGGDHTPMSPPNFVDLRREAALWQDLVAADPWSVNLEEGGGDGAGAERVRSSTVTAGYFTLLGVPLAAGRDFTGAEDEAGAAPTVILEHELATRLAAGRAVDGAGDGGPDGAEPRVADLLGETVRIDGTLHTVVGIAPPGFDFPRRSQMWRPFRWNPQQLGPRSARFLIVVGRLAPGASPAAAEEELQAAFARLAEEYPDGNAEYEVGATPLQEWVVPEDSRRSLGLLAGAVFLVLLIACVNVVNLLLARGEARHREFAVRSALGAGRGAVVRQFVLEALLVALAGGALGALLARLGTRLLVSSAASALPRHDEVAVDGTVLLFALGLSVLCGLGVALVPAWRHARGDSWEGLRSSRGLAGEGGWTRRALVVAEVALAVVLLLGTGLLVESFYKLHRVDLGLEPESLVGGRLELPSARYPDAGSVDSFYVRLDEALATLPGVEGAARVNRLPFARSNINVTSLQVDGEPDRESNFVELRAVTPDYFGLVGLRLLAGRGFTEADRNLPEENPVVPTVINQQLAQELFADVHEAVGSRLNASWGFYQLHVVGVVEDLRDFGAHRDTPPAFYLPEGSVVPGIRDRAILVRAAGDPAAVMPLLRRTVAELDPGLPLYDLARLSDMARDRLARPRMVLDLLLLFAGLALVLGAVGVYSVMSYLVERRTQEIGVRMALGASLERVLGLVLRQGAAWAVTGIVLGLAAGVALSRFLEHVLFEVRPTDPLVLATVSLVLLAVALAACWIPAHRAAKVSPMEALRQE